MRLKRLISVLVIFLLSVSAFAQTAKEELIGINKKYAELKGFSMNISVSMFSKADDYKPAQQFNGEVRKNSHCFYSSIMGQTSLMNRHCQLVVDEQQKVIYYDGNSLKKIKPAASPQDISTVLDSLLFQDYTFAFTTSANGTRTVEITPLKNPDYFKRMLITYISSSHEITAISYFYDVNEDNGGFEKVSIGYSQIQLGQEPPDEFFSEEKFITRTKNQVKAAPAYAAFQVIDISEPVVSPE